MIAEAEGGRIYIPKKLRDELGEKFHLVRKDEKLVLVPVSDQPLKSLREEFEDVDKSAEEMKKEA